MSTKFHFFKKPNIFFKIFVGVSIVFISLFSLDYIQTKEFNTTLFIGTLLQAFIILFITTRNTKYYVEFFKDEILLNYFKYKNQLISFESIENINVKMFEVELTIKNDEKPITLDLNNCKDDTRQAVKTKFNTLAGRLK